MSIPRLLLALALLVGASSAVRTEAQTQTQPPPATPLPVPGQTGALQLQFDQAKRLVDEFEYRESIPLFDALISAIALNEQALNIDMLAQAYELRATAHFALGETAEAEQDFAALLSVRPEHRLAENTSSRVLSVFDAVRLLTVGQVAVSMSPPGNIQIDRRTYPVPAEGVILDLQAGDHQLTVTRSGFAPVSQSLTVTAGESRDLVLTLERVSANLEVQTTTSGVEVLLDGQPRGMTASTGGGVATLMLNDLPLGSHRLSLRRDCFVTAERTISLVADDLRTDPIELERATAAVQVQTSAQGALMFVDGQPNGPAPGTLTVCEGAHVIEVRGPTGRFVDRREWRAGGSETLEATLRSAFAIVAVSGDGAEAVLNQLKSDVARVLGPASGVLVYEPVAAELQAAMQAENIPAGWLEGAVTRADTALPRDVLRDFGRRLAARLGVQGFAAVVAGAERFQVSVGLQALGSGEPEVLSFSTADQASQRAVLDRLANPLPPITRPSIESSVIDVAGLAGPVVVRVGGVGEAAGLATGDVITGVNGTAVASVGEFRTALGAMDGTSAVALDVTGSGAARQVSVTPALAAEVLPLRDSSLLYNLALLKLQELTQTAVSPAERAAAHVNLAIVLLRLGSWDEALQSLGQARLGDGPGVSAGTVAYLRGLALDGAGRGAEAQAAFKEAASAPQARLGSQGPLVSPLARLRLSGGLE